MTDVGRQRKHNEDNVLVKSELGLFVVADGMGGHNAGNVASALATKSLDNFFEATRTGSLPGPVPADEQELDPEARRIVAAIRKANHDVFVISNTYTQHQGMGSTVVAAYVSSETEQIHVGHVGDSRCYRIRHGEIEQLTKDHSLINDALALKPDLSQDELARLPKNIITRALGMKDAVKVDIRSERIQLGDVFLLCSDGLSGMVSEQQMLDVFDITQDPREACELLIAMANEAGGTDNISALIICIQPDTADEQPDDLELEDTRPHRIDELDAALPPELAETEPPAAAEEIDLGAAALPDGGRIVPQQIRAILGSEPRGEVQSASGTLSRMAAVPFTDRRSRAAAGSGRYAAVAAAARPALKEAPSVKPARRPTEVRVARCAHCQHELFIGNRFCVECGAPIKG
ncbi:Stp1/IreP family PP2C-type Ser/Thr phosphatase [Sorangium cellulosum]|uniref:Stp1/IreP family PP2C-type Ser/Thr phosphatase n=1 Tax=Sorangium cellulosum TaxID=56 RepID=UPI001F158755|nr:Stp1/IreP family PP2C-type Ser/Thr phosphatase [Sorangium cellulosum]